MDRKQKRTVLLAMLFVVVCGLAYVVLRMGTGKTAGLVLEPKTEMQVSEPKDGLPQEKTAGEAESGKDDFAEATPAAEVSVVHVCGAVKQEGVYSLPVGSRITDAVAAAGGFSEAADVTFHNLAAKVDDGEKIYVPTIEETKTLSVTERVNRVTGQKEENGTPDGIVNLNTAGKEELMTLDGIGESRAESILHYRQKTGPFQKIEELKNISGIGDAMFERIRDRITVE